MSGVKGRSGRHKDLPALMNEAMNMVDQRLPEYFEQLSKLALKGDKDALIYLIDRRMGRPRQEIDQRVKAIIGFTADDYELMDRIKANDSKVIEGIVLPLLAPVALDNEPQKTTDNEQKQP